MVKALVLLCEHIDYSCSPGGHLLASFHLCGLAACADVFQQLRVRRWGLVRVGEGGF